MTTKARGDGTKLEYTVAGSPVVADVFELVQDTLGVHTISAAVGETAVLATTGEFLAPKATGETWTAGENIWWHTVNENFQANATGGTLRAKAMADQVSGDTEGLLVLIPNLV